MEFSSAYRDPLLAFAEAMSQWYRRYRDTLSQNCGASVTQLPVDRASPRWILHLLNCATPPPAAKARLEQVAIDPSELRFEGVDNVLILTNSSGLPLGFDVLPGDWASSLGRGEAGQGEGVMATTQRILELLRSSMKAPMYGGLARRPQTLTVSDKKLHRVLSSGEKSLSVLKVALLPEAVGGWVPIDVGPETGSPRPRVFNMRWPPTYYCRCCKKHSFLSQLKPCAGCKAVLFCAGCCPGATLPQAALDSGGHHCCKRLSLYMRRGEQLALLPFPYATETTSEDFDVEDFLFKNKLSSGYWLHWSLLVRSPRFQLHSSLEQSKDLWLSDHSEPYGPLKEEANILLSHIPHNSPCLSAPLVSWSQYMSWRGLSLTSPVSVLLSSALSTYYIITSLVPQDFPEMNILNKQSLKIHIIESYREFHTLMSFWELSVLLPQMTFELSFIGERLPQKSDKQQLFLQKKSGGVSLVNPAVGSEEKADRRSIRIKVYKRAYHMLLGPKPDLVIGFSPAIPLHDLWLSALPRLQSLRVPAYFCELSELSCESSQQVMSSATGGALSSPALNPFHSPLRICGGDNLLPWYSNAFIFHLIYKPLAPCPQRPSLTSNKAGVHPDPQQPANQRVATPQQNPPPESFKMTRRERKRTARNTHHKRK
ncbi:zinc finger MYND domain-containing protein 15 [Electrophorus electricus]|uniref:zinc finger MYND domain-containing protein 15 n=1 Tax=Electrophorus electricus TaxID=8005 RepID=UPI0015CFFC85|nr:zinc finger MYND domain-containing protein 15 [Electrophorus electricus]